MYEKNTLSHNYYDKITLFKQLLMIMNVLVVF